MERFAVVAPSTAPDNIPVPSPYRLVRILDRDDAQEMQEDRQQWERVYEMQASMAFDGSALFTVQDQGAFLWPATEPFCRYLLQLAHGTTTIGEELLRNRTIVELGSGALGLSAMLVANYFQPQAVIATDFDTETLRVLQQNLDRNRMEYVTCQQLDWREPVPAELRADTVIGCDLVWDEDTCDLVCNMAQQLLLCPQQKEQTSPESPLFLLSFVVRSAYLQEYLESALRRCGMSAFQRVDITEWSVDASVVSEMRTSVAYRCMPVLLYVWHSKARE